MGLPFPRHFPTLTVLLYTPHSQPWFPLRHSTWTEGKRGEALGCWLFPHWPGPQPAGQPLTPSPPGARVRISLNLHPH